jgi:hypothetical protein
MAALTREGLLGAHRGDIHTVSTPGLGSITSVCLRALSGAEALAVYSAADPTDEAGQPAKADQAAKLGVSFTQAATVASICDENGKRILTKEDGDALFELPYSALQPIIEKALEINRMTKASAEAAKKG